MSVPFHPAVIARERERLETEAEQARRAAPHPRAALRQAHQRHTEAVVEVERLAEATRRAQDHLAGVAARRDVVEKEQAEQGAMTVDVLTDTFTRGDTPPAGSSGASALRSSLAQVDREHALAVGALQKLEEQLSAARAALSSAEGARGQAADMAAVVAHDGRGG
jgi:hypothetical protein